MANANLAFAALSDPTRRGVFERLQSGESSVGDLARGLPVSRAAGLVVDRAEGTRRVYRIDPHGLGSLRAWLDRFWGLALQAYADQVERTEGEQ